MKKFYLSGLALCVVWASFAQSEKYVQAMESKILWLDSAHNPAAWNDLAHSFERIATTEKTQWLPFYYAAYSYVMAGYTSVPAGGGMSDNSSITDSYSEKAAGMLNQAEAIAGSHSEIHCVRKMIHTLFMTANPMQRYMTESPLAAAALEKAKAMNPDNPRVYILEGQDKFYTPEQYGGSKAEAKLLFEKALQLFQTAKPGNALEPQWGRTQLQVFLAQLQ